MSGAVVITPPAPGTAGLEPEVHHPQPVPVSRMPASLLGVDQAHSSEVAGKRKQDDQGLEGARIA
jgi:hypothetical protein